MFIFCLAFCLQRMRKKRRRIGVYMRLLQLLVTSLQQRLQHRESGCKYGFFLFFLVFIFLVFVFSFFVFVFIFLVFVFISVFLVFLVFLLLLLLLLLVFLFFLPTSICSIFSGPPFRSLQCSFPSSKDPGNSSLSRAHKSHGLCGVRDLA